MQQAKDYFFARHIQLKQQWLECVMQYKQSSPDYQHMDLINFIFEQWLHSELSDSTHSVLTESISEKRSVISGPLVLQVNWVIDIQNSAYFQLLQTTNQDTDFMKTEDDDELEKYFGKSSSKVKCRHIFYLMEVTDGQYCFYACSLKNESRLIINFTPGMKILLCGSPICRRRILLLENIVIQRLGGDSERHFSSSLPPNVFLRRLHSNGQENLFLVNNSLPVKFTNNSDETSKKSVKTVQKIPDDLNCCEGRQCLRKMLMTYQNIGSTSKKALMIPEKPCVTNSGVTTDEKISKEPAAENVLEKVGNIQNVARMTLVSVMRVVFAFIVFYEKIYEKYSGDLKNESGIKKSDVKADDFLALIQAIIIRLNKLNVALRSYLMLFKQMSKDREHSCLKEFQLKEMGCRLENINLFLQFSRSIVQMLISTKLLKSLSVS